MRHPAYHLRPNKAVDRYLLIELLLRLNSQYNIGSYRYLGLGGPFLEDFRLIAQYFPTVRLISVEKNEQTLKRQRFHKPTKNVLLERGDLTSFLAQYDDSERDIFWLDYTTLTYACIEDFTRVLSLIGDNSIVRITVRAEPGINPIRLEESIGKEAAEPRIQKYFEDFKLQFEKVIPAEASVSDLRGFPFVVLIQNMLRTAAQETLPASAGRTFQIVSASVYDDETQMYSLTGVVCSIEETRRVRRMLRRWKHGNLDWNEPRRIDVPVLSMKERLALDAHLPSRGVKQLARVLGYNIDNGRQRSLRQLEQYVDFYRYYPQFAKVIV